MRIVTQIVAGMRQGGWGFLDDLHDLLRMGLWECVPHTVKIRLFLHGNPMVRVRIRLTVPKK